MALGGSTDERDHSKPTGQSSRHGTRGTALAAWRKELSAGRRAATDFDALWRAACLEVDALEAESSGLQIVAERQRKLAVAYHALAAQEARS